MPEGQKEPENIQNFDETEYKANLVDKEGYSEETAAMLAAKKKEKLANAPPVVAKMIEINLGEL